MDKELTPKQQVSEAIRQAEAILVMTGQHPSVDQVAATLALTSILKKFGKKVTAVISDDVPQPAKFLPISKVDRNIGGLRDFILQVDLSNAEVDKLKYTIEGGKLNVHITPFSGGFHQKDVSFAYGEYHFDLVVVLGVASYGRIDKVYAQNAELLRKIPMVNIDYHRINEQYGAVNLIEPTAGSLSEMLIALSESLQAGLIDEEIATTMLAGIMASTDRFTASHTTSKTMTIAAQMLAMGADQQKVVRNLYKSDKDKKSTRKDKGQAVQDKPASTERQPSQSVQSTPVSIEAAPSDDRTHISAKPAQVQSAPMSEIPEPRPEPSPVVRAPQAQPATVVPEPIAQPEKPVEPVNPEPQPAGTVSPPPVAAVQSEPQADPEPRFDPPKLNNQDAVADAPAVQSSPEEPTPAKESDPGRTDEGVMEELLPPQHIELSPSDEKSRFQAQDPAPEPLINDTSDQQPRPAASQPRKPSNPTNNPIFAQRLDEFEI